MEPGPAVRAARVGRYLLQGTIATGGMARVHLGRATGAAGFGRVVAIKRMHPQYASDPKFVAMFTDEARLTARIRHPNVVPTLDVVSTEDGELLLVMEYVAGESLARLAARTHGERVPTDVALAIARDALSGLHAAHDATGEDGAPLHVVHRDVSPQNLLVGADGVTRVLDFGVAKAAGRAHTTKDGSLKGKLAYMAPEQLRGEKVDRRTDLWAMGVVLWELLAGRELFAADNEGEVVTRVLEGAIEAPGAGAAVDAIVMRALAREPKRRFATAAQMAAAIEASAPVASARRVAEWVAEIAGDVLEARAGDVAAAERARPVDTDAAIVRTPPSARSRAPWGWIGAALAIAAALAWAAARGPTTAPATPTTSAPASAPAPSLTAPTPTPTPTLTLSPTPTLAPAPTPTLAPTLAPTPTLTLTPPASASASMQASARATPSNAPSAAASDGPCPLRPYVDEEGIVRFKRDCRR